ncbi:hypothetical protein A5740_19035 [Mycobacterium sp. GA-1841]|uniref:hypothetical protein n=1 Tax=Mycobacterium sp. GA-1841 TaxID=1834154 RepID=UPI00096D42AC|nr:hypothetical protein [Mycobacterium sp. GA-1841]OMC29023.1 hypothetical protein A5740_19035 [Mycobacterium sp. GA-1841]
MTSHFLRANSLATVLGGSALIAMGVIGAPFVNAPDGQGLIPSSKMTLGETTTVTNSGTVVPIVAAPPVKAKPYGKG